jgi:hypothetical protein
MAEDNKVKVVEAGWDDEVAPDGSVKVVQAGWDDDVDATGSVKKKEDTGFVAPLGSTWELTGSASPTQTKAAAKKAEPVRGGVGASAPAKKAVTPIVDPERRLNDLNVQSASLQRIANKTQKEAELLKPKYDNLRKRLEEKTAFFSSIQKEFQGRTDISPEAKQNALSKYQAEIIELNKEFTPIEQSLKKSYEMLDLADKKLKGIQEEQDKYIGQLDAGSSIANSFSNVVTSIKGAPARAALSIDAMQKAFTRTAVKAYGALTGQDDEVTDVVANVVSSNYPNLFMPTKTVAETEKMATKQLGELEEEMLPTRGLFESIEKGDVLGTAAAMVNAGTAILSTAASSIPTAGIGLYTDLVGQSLYDYNKAKADALKIDIDKLYETGNDDVAVPVIIGTAAAMLEKTGLEGISKAINRNISKATVREAIKFSNDLVSEGWTELLQFGLDAVNKAAAEGKDVDELGGVFVDAITSKEGIESGLNGLVGSGVSVATGKAAKGLYNYLSPARKKNVLSDYQVAEAAANDLRNPELTPEKAQVVLTIAKDATDKIKNEAFEQADENLRLNEDEATELSEANHSLKVEQDAVSVFEGMLQDESVSEETKNAIKGKIESAKKIIQEIGDRIDGIYDKAKARGARVKDFLRGQEEARVTEMEDFYKSLKSAESPTEEDKKILSISDITELFRRKKESRENVKKLYEEAKRRGQIKALEKEEQRKLFIQEQRKNRDLELEEIAKMRPDLTDSDLLLIDLPDSVDKVLDRVDANIPSDPVAISEAIDALDKKFDALEAYKNDPKRTHTIKQIDEVIDALSDAKSTLQFYDNENKEYRETKGKPEIPAAQVVAPEQEEIGVRLPELVEPQAGEAVPEVVGEAAEEALRDVESTAKALEGKDVVQYLRDKANALRDEEGNVPKEKMDEWKAIRKASGAVNDGLVQIPESAYENTGRSKKFTPQQISEAYHKAKSDGSNPELVKAVEELLTPKQEQDAKEQQGRQMRDQGKQGEAEGLGNRNLPEGDRAQLQDGQKAEEVDSEREQLLMTGEAEERRTKGRYTKDGIEYVRQKEDKGIRGKQGEVRFAKNVVVKFTYKLIEAKRAQASHKQGIRNPLFFIPEAQPKNRTDKESIAAEQNFAYNPRFGELGYSNIAYEGAPTVNKRDEGIQGHNRLAGIRLGYELGQTKYKEELAKNAEQFGFTEDQVMSMEEPMLVRELDVTDDYAIELGNYVFQDVETGGDARIQPARLIKRIPVSKKVMLLGMLTGDDTINGMLRKNFNDVFSILNPYLNSAQKMGLKREDGTPKPSAIEDLESLVLQFLFDGGDVQLNTVFENLPYYMREGIVKSLRYLLESNKEKSLLPDVQEALIILRHYEMSGSGNFDAFLNQYDAYNNVTPSSLYSPVSIAIAKRILSEKKISAIPPIFAEYKRLVTDKPGDMYEEATKGVSKAEAIKTIFNIDYEEQSKPKEQGGPEGGYPKAGEQAVTPKPGEAEPEAKQVKPNQDEQEAEAKQEDGEPMPKGVSGVRPEGKAGEEGAELRPEEKVGPSGPVKLGFSAIDDMLSLPKDEYQKARNELKTKYGAEKVADMIAITRKFEQIITGLEQANKIRKECP